MGFTIQMERHAIEEATGIMPELPPRSAFALITGNGTGESTPLHLVGVSEGFGTCSNVHGVNVLGLSLNQPENVHAPHLVPSCRVAVLFRPATPEEIARNGGNRATAAVDLLQFVMIDKKGVVYFRLTGRSVTYVVLA